MTIQPQLTRAELETALNAADTERCSINMNDDPLTLGCKRMLADLLVPILNAKLETASTPQGKEAPGVAEKTMRPKSTIPGSFSNPNYGHADEDTQPAQQEIPMSKPCAACRGTGQHPGIDGAVCPVCEGDGKKPQPAQAAGDLRWSDGKVCPECGLWCHTPDYHANTCLQFRPLSAEDLRGAADVPEIQTAWDAAHPQAAGEGLDRTGALAKEIKRQQDGGRELPFTRDELGAQVRLIWTRWAFDQPNCKPSWMVPYSQLSESDKEVDRRIGEEIARIVVIAESSRLYDAHRGELQVQAAGEGTDGETKIAGQVNSHIAARAMREAGVSEDDVAIVLGVLPCINAALDRCAGWGDYFDRLEGLCSFAGMELISGKNRGQTILDFLREKTAAIAAKDAEIDRLTKERDEWANGGLVAMSRRDDLLKESADLRSELAALRDRLSPLEEERDAVEHLLIDGSIDGTRTGAPPGVRIQERLLKWRDRLSAQPQATEKTLQTTWDRLAQEKENAVRDQEFNEAYRLRDEMDSIKLKIKSASPQAEPTADPLADLVSRFSTALLAKLQAAEAKYGHNNGWLRDDWRADLIRHLREHMQKGDPRDVAAYCAFAWHHGWSVALEKEGDLLELVKKIARQKWTIDEWRGLIREADNIIDLKGAAEPTAEGVTAEMVPDPDRISGFRIAEYLKEAGMKHDGALPKGVRLLEVARMVSERLNVTLDGKARGDASTGEIPHKESK